LDINYGKEGTLIKMSKYNMPNMSGGIDSTLVDVSQTIPIFVPFLLVFVFFFIFLSGAITQKSKSGHADMPLWMTLASMGTLLITLSMTLVDGLVDSVTLGVVIAITILSFIWLALGSTNTEV